MRVEGLCCGNALLCVTLVVIIGTHQVCGSGRMTLNLLSYENPGGKGDNGHCCDGRAIFCESGGGCDHYFVVCVDAYTSEDGHDQNDPCTLGSVTTGVIHNQASITFGSDIGGTANPIAFNFRSWQSPGVKIKVIIYDHDANHDDYVDYVYLPVRITPAVDEAHASGRTLSLSDRTTLRLQAKVWCDRYWYGDTCSTYCRASDSDRDGHYTCHSSTGAKICRPGWEGPLCKENINECASEPCLHGGTCSDWLNGYTCTCVTGTSGRHCEEVVDPCFSSPCLNNATCQPQDTQNYQCMCTEGWTGNDCDSPVVHSCPQDHCENGGTCTEFMDGYLCHCEEGFTGDRCQDEDTSNACLSNPCQNGGSCEDLGGLGYICMCSGIYHGQNCEHELITVPKDKHIPEFTTVHMQADLTTDKQTNEVEFVVTLPLSPETPPPKGDIPPTRAGPEAAEWSAVFLNGTLDKEELLLVEQSLRKTAIRLLNSSVTSVTIIHKVHVCTHQDKVTITVYYFRIYQNGKELSPGKVRSILKMLTKEEFENLFPRPVHYGELGVNPCSDSTIHMAHRVDNKPSWVSQYWYIVVAVGAAVGLIIIIALVVRFKKSRSKKSQYQVNNRPLSGDSTGYNGGPPVNQVDRDQLPSVGFSTDAQCFDNATYSAMDVPPNDPEGQPILPNARVNSNASHYDVLPRNSGAEVVNATDLDYTEYEGENPYELTTD